MHLNSTNMSEIPLFQPAPTTTTYDQGIDYDYEAVINWVKILTTLAKIKSHVEKYVAQRVRCTPIYYA